MKGLDSSAGCLMALSGVTAVVLWERWLRPWLFTRRQAAGPTMPSCICCIQKATPACMPGQWLPLNSSSACICTCAGHSEAVEQLKLGPLCKDTSRPGLAELQLQRPLISFDLETTGFCRAGEYIVEIAAIKLFPDGHQEQLSTLVKPPKSIPPAATKVTPSHSLKEDTCSTPACSLPLSTPHECLLLGCRCMASQTRHVRTPPALQRWLSSSMHSLMAVTWLGTTLLPSMCPSWRWSSRLAASSSLQSAPASWTLCW